MVIACFSYLPRWLQAVTEKMVLSEEEKNLSPRVFWYYCLSFYTKIYAKETLENFTAINRRRWLIPWQMTISLGLWANCSTYRNRNLDENLRAPTVSLEIPITWGEPVWFTRILSVFPAREEYMSHAKTENGTNEKGPETFLFPVKFTILLFLVFYRCFVFVLFF